MQSSWFHRPLFATLLHCSETHKNVHIPSINSSVLIPFLNWWCHCWVISITSLKRSPHSHQAYQRLLHFPAIVRALHLLLFWHYATKHHKDPCNYPVFSKSHTIKAKHDTLSWLTILYWSFSCCVTAKLKYLNCIFQGGKVVRSWNSTPAARVQLPPR